MRRICRCHRKQEPVLFGSSPRWSRLIDADQQRPIQSAPDRARFDDAGSSHRLVPGPASMVTYGPEQYKEKPESEWPSKPEFAVRKARHFATGTRSIRLPKTSATGLRGKLGTERLLALLAARRPNRCIPIFSSVSFRSVHEVGIDPQKARFNRNTPRNSAPHPLTWGQIPVITIRSIRTSLGVCKFG